MKKIHENNFTYPSINWQKGLLKKYESFESFVAKFCLFNKLTPKQFKKYWKNKVIAHDFESELDKLYYIMTLLNEPYDVVSTVFSSEVIEVDIISRQLPITKYKVRYCNECIKLGYHSYFHNKIWLKNCPIHDNSLITEENPKNYIKPNKSSFELRIIALSKLYIANYWKRITDNLEFKRIEELWLWLVELENEYQNYTLVQLDFITKNSEIVDIDTLVLFFNTIYPKKRNLNQVNGLKKLYRLSKSASKELENLLNIIPLYFLVNFYQIYCGFNIKNLKKQYIEFIENEKVRITNLHTEKLCLWSRKDLIGNWEYCEYNKHNSLYEVCIFEYISEKISNDWLDFKANRTKDVYRIYTIYNDCSRKLIKNLLARNREDGTFPKLLDLHFSKELIDFLDLILIELAKNYIQNLNEWLNFHVKNHTVKLRRPLNMRPYMETISYVYLKVDQGTYFLVNAYPDKKHTLY
ncbi:hypothetical protein ABFP05_16250 [Acinetobacter baumannii]